MPRPSRTQLVVYVALAVTALLLGARWIRGAEAPAAGVESAHEASDAVRVERGGGALIVHVAGEVERPGVYRLPAQARVADAVKRAGGVTRAGAADGINLAARLADGQQIVVPARAPAPGGARAASGGGAASAAAAPDAPISLGTATAEQLEAIEGIGPVTAQKIIEFRDSRGGLSSIDELDQISGIGPVTMEALRARLQP